jgi:arginyl-tRNA synthetase
MIKDELTSAVLAALKAAQAAGDLPATDLPAIAWEMPRNPEHGDWATNIALVLAKPLDLSARDVAAKLLAHLDTDGALIESARIAGPGFINLNLKPQWLAHVVRGIIAAGDAYGRSAERSKGRVLVEFVSTNPNGPITVAGGRNAAIGDVVASLLQAVGYDVVREYYINDALNSSQMVNFGRSVLHRYRQLLGHELGVLDEAGEEPDWLYRGDYIGDIAQQIIDRCGREFEDSTGDDALTIQKFRELSQGGMLEQQRADLEAFGVRFDNWFSEAVLHESGRVQQAIDELGKRGYTYEKEGALWFRSTACGDDKDRVLVRASGTPTYLAGDAAYHKDKFERGFDLTLDVWGADHAGYVARTKAVVQALGYDPARLAILLYQLVRIMKDGELVKSSKRRGDVLELKSDLVDEIGRDAARFFFLMRSPGSELDIDLELAKKTERENPVYYVQYAHARIAQTLEKAAELDAGWRSKLGGADLGLLTQESEIVLIKKLSELPDEIGQAAAEYAPQRITQYARDLAALFHAFYDGGNRNPELRIVSSDPALQTARLALAEATRITLRNTLTLLGVSAPDRM